MSHIYIAKTDSRDRRDVNHVMKLARNFSLATTPHKGLLYELVISKHVKRTNTYDVETTISLTIPQRTVPPA